MQVIFTVELGNQISLILQPSAFKTDLPKQVPILLNHKKLLGLADVYINNGVIKAAADIPEEFLSLAPVPVFEVDEEIAPVNNKPNIIVKATLLSIGLMPHNPGDLIQSLTLQMVNKMPPHANKTA